MDTEEKVAPFAATTTRRKIVTTGAKLAYAAPIVAVSMKTNIASAAECQPGQDSCNGTDYPCGDCANSFCSNDTEGNIFCAQFTGLSCETYTKCAKSSDCPSGQRCAPGPDCCGGICVGVCGGGTVSGIVTKGNVVQTAGVPPH